MFCVHPSVKCQNKSQEVQGAPLTHSDIKNFWFYEYVPYSLQIFFNFFGFFYLLFSLI